MSVVSFALAVIFIIKQKTRFENFGNIGYRPMNGRYIGIGLKKNISVDLHPVQQSTVTTAT